MTTQLVSLLLAASFFDSSAPNRRYRLHRDPTLFVTGIAEGSDGRLWLANATGLVRYDGFRFEQFTEPPLSLARDVDFSADGTLWVSTTEGLVRFGDKAEIVFPVDTNHVAAIGNTLVHRSRFGTWKMDTAGRREPAPGCSADIYYGHVLVSHNREFQLVCEPRSKIGKFGASWSSVTTTSSFDGNWVRAVTDSRGDTWLETHDKKFYRVRKGETVPQPHPAPHYTRLFQYRLFSDTGDSAWFLGNPTVNLTKDYSLDRGRERRRVTHMATGVRDNIWIAEQSFGLVEYKLRPGWESWTSEQIGAAAFQVLKLPRGLVLYSDRGLLRVSNGQITPLSTKTPAIRHLTRLSDSRFLATVPSSGLEVLDTAGKVVQRIPHPADIERPNWPERYEQAGVDGNGRVWVTGPELLEWAGKDGERLLKETRLPKHRSELAVREIRIDSAGRPWVGYREGIAYLEDKRWTPVNTDKPFREVRSIELHGKDIWVALRAPGPFLRLRPDGERWHVEELVIEDGGEASQTHWVRVDSRGWIWRGVADGVRVSDGKNLRDWLYLREQNGLDVGTPGAHGFAEDDDGSIWIAGSRGIAHFTPDPAWFEAPHDASPPIISGLTVQGRHTSARVGGLHMPEFREEPIEYRLVPLFEDWRGTRDGSLKFLDLADGEYQLEVRYGGVGTSPLTTRSFRIGPAPWRFPWLGATGGLGALGVAWLMLRNTKLYRRAVYQAEKKLFLMRPENTKEQANQPALSPGMSVQGRFEVVRTIAQGGFSTVYEARDLETREQIALKVMTQGPDDSWLRNRFSHELNALRTVEHRHVVRLIAGGVSGDGLLFLAMPFLDGVSLHKELQDGPLDCKRAIESVGQLASALEAIHTNGIVHLDVKPENIIMTPDGAVLIDFGTSGLRGPEDAMSVTKMLSGSAFYMAPERLTGHYSSASDIYALGLVALEMLTGKRLNDFQTPSFQPGFLDELAVELEAVAGTRAHEAAAALFAAFEVLPNDRPGKPSEWLKTWAHLIGSTP